MGEVIKHPTVYVFLGGEPDTAEAVLREAEQTHPAGGLFYASGEDVRGVKTRIQSGESGLSIKRVNVYAIAEGLTAVQADETGLRIRDLFREGFTTVKMTLIVLLPEARSEAELEFLPSLSAEAYDRVFLLSDRDELDIVNPANRQRLHKLIASLPLLHNAPSYFDEIITAKARERGRTLFVSAGIWQKEKPEPKDGELSPAAINALHCLAGVLEKNMAARPNRDEPTAVAEPVDPTAEIISDITGVAARPIRFWQLWGHSLKEAEAILYGEEAAEFFARHYAPEESAPTEDTADEESLTLSEAASEEQRLRHILPEMAKNIAFLTHKIEGAEKEPQKAFVDRVKDAIGECYAKCHELNQLRRAHAKLTARHGRLESYLDYIRYVIEQLKSLKLPEAGTPDTPEETEAFLLANGERLAPLAISLLRDDGLIREQLVLYGADGEPRLIRLIGGFAPEDLT
ncbi:MAG: hypothetical protein FWB91_00415 [Defluviitaleaceae bacterium]|nr:hypothetical protein [Defluviitaleaceae bacterium]